MPRRHTRATAGRRGRPSALASATTLDLQRELERRQGMMQELMRQRDTLTAELSELEAVFGNSFGGGPRRLTLGRPVGGKRRGRPMGSKNRTVMAGTRTGRGQNAMNLVDSLRAVITGKTLTVANLAQSVQDAGYKTNSANFRTIVNQALLANPKLFKKVARGEYTGR